MRDRLRIPLLLLGALAGAGHAQPPPVVTSILPVHSLVSGVMEGIDEPVLLLAGNTSPHDHALRPSQARLLQQARLVFRIGHELEAFLDKPLASLSSDARVIDLIDVPGVSRLATRGGDDWLSPDGGDQPASERDEPHGHGPVDAHIWLSPPNADAMLGAITDALTAADPMNAARYAANSQRVRERIADQERRWRARLAPVGRQPFVVHHDAYQYLERHFGLNAIGAVTASPDRQPSAIHVRELLARMQATGARCVFREPQLDSPLIDMVVASSGARASALDPLGIGLEPGASAWFQLMEANVESLANCLAQR